MTQDSSGIARSAFERGDAARASPTLTVLDTDDDVLVEESGVFEKADGGFWREFVGTTFSRTVPLKSHLGIPG